MAERDARIKLDDRISGRVAAGLRRALNITLEEVTAESGMTRQTIANYEAGRDHKASTAAGITAALKRLIAKKTGRKSPGADALRAALLDHSNDVERSLITATVVWLLSGDDEDDRR